MTPCGAHAMMGNRRSLPPCMCAWIEERLSTLCAAPGQHLHCAARAHLGVVGAEHVPHLALPALPKHHALVPRHGVHQAGSAPPCSMQCAHELVICIRACHAAGQVGAFVCMSRTRQHSPLGYLWMCAHINCCPKLRVAAELPESTSTRVLLNMGTALTTLVAGEEDHLCAALRHI